MFHHLGKEDDSRGESHDSDPHLKTAANRTLPASVPRAVRTDEQRCSQTGRNHRKPSGLTRNPLASHSLQNKDPHGHPSCSKQTWK